MSRKVRSALTAKRRAGEFIGAWAPYGYQKDPKQPGKLVPDPESAGVVRRIYRDFLKGESVRGIAEGLTEDKIPTPMEKRSGGLKAQKMCIRDRVKCFLAMLKFKDNDWEQEGCGLWPAAERTAEG